MASEFFFNATTLVGAWVATTVLLAGIICAVIALVIERREKKEEKLFKQTLPILRAAQEATWASPKGVRKLDDMLISAHQSKLFSVDFKGVGSFEVRNVAMIWYQGDCVYRAIESETAGSGLCREYRPGEWEQMLLDCVKEPRIEE